VHPRLQPDLTLVFDATYEVSSKRLAATGRRLDRFESEDRAFFDRVRSAYRRLAESEPGRVRLIDGTRPPEQVKADVEKLISTI
jgi:dTMP kinase